MTDLDEESSLARAERRRFRRRFGLRTFCLLLVLIPVGYSLWSSTERAGLDAMVARYRARGEPMRLEDFASHPSSAAAAADNPAVELEVAAAAVDRTIKDVTIHEFGFPLTPREAGRLGLFVRAQSAAFAHVDAAEQRTGPVDWQVALKSPLVTTNFKLMPQRDLAMALRYAVFEAHGRGDDAEALRRVRQILFLARANYQQPGLIGHLVGDSFVAVAGQAVHQIAPDLAVGANAGASHPASPEHVHALIADLLDDRAQRAARKPAAQFERIVCIDFAHVVAARGLTATSSSTGGNVLAGYFFAPLAFRDARIAIGYWDGIIDAWQADTAPACYKGFDALPNPDSFDWRTHPVLRTILPAFRRAATQDYNALTDARLAALALAMRLYALDHDGKFPTDLNALVPAYLSRIPDDPLAPSGPLRFAPDTARIYSVGPNNVDDGGSDKPLHPNPRGGNNIIWDQLDRVVYLTRQPRPLIMDDLDEIDPPTPATQPADTQPPHAP